MRNFFIFYGVAAFVIGAAAASMRTVDVTIRGVKIKSPVLSRLLFFVLAGAMWPVVFYQIVMGRR